MSAKTQKSEPESYETLTHLLAEIESPGALVEAAKKVADAGYTRFDAHSPFPIHGIDPAMRIKMTILPWIVFLGGATGLAIALGMQYYLNAVVVPEAGRFSGWEWVISGKPMWSSPANIPIAFELTVLLSAFATFFGMWGLNKLPKVWHPLFQSDRFLRVTDDSFFLSIEASDAKFQPAETEAFLHSIGATAVEPIHIVTGPAHRKMPKSIVGFILVTAILGLVPFAFLANARGSKASKPHFHAIPNMDFQPKLGAQDAYEPFADDRGTQLHPTGTVARGADDLAADDHYYRGVDGTEWAQEFPAQVNLDTALMARGQNRYNIYCAPCHGSSGDGAGVVHLRADAVGATTTGWNPPTDLRQEPIARLPHGQIFNTVTHGVRTMPGYGAQIPEADRWAVIFYLRALQRAECNALASIPADMQPRIKGGKAGAAGAAPAPAPAPAPAAGDQGPNPAGGASLGPKEVLHDRAAETNEATEDSEDVNAGDTGGGAAE
jgi:mono/diheme cytochrome c family protein